MRTEKTRVAVYRRVSRDQRSYASLIGADARRINSESGMLYAGSYIDLDGCRSAFKRLMAVADEGNIDRIETESISAFANNIGELLITVCKLRCLRHPVAIHFEEEDVTTGTAESTRRQGHRYQLFQINHVICPFGLPDHGFRESQRKII